MDDATVWLAVKARDEASATLKKVSDQAKGLGSTMGTVLKVGAVAAAGGIGVAAIAAKSFIGDASNLAESLSKVNVVFGDQADEIKEWASTSARGLGQTRQQALEMAGTFGNLFDALGLTQQQSVDMSKSVVELGTDLASFNNIGTDEALEKLRAGLVGEAEPLRALGVNITAATTEAMAMKMGLEQVNGEFTDAAKVQARYALILEQTTNAQGDFERTSGGLANQQRILSAQWGDLRAQIGTALMPVMLAFVSVLAGHVVPALAAGAEHIGTFANLIGAALSGDLATAAGLFEQLPGPLQAVALVLADIQPKIVSLATNARELGVTLVQAFGPHLQAIGEQLLEVGVSVGMLLERANEAGVFKAALIGVAAAVLGLVVAIEGLLAVVVPMTNFLVENEAALAGLAAVIITVLIPGVIAWTVATWAQVTATASLAAATVIAYAPFFAIALVIGLVIAAVVLLIQHWDKVVEVTQTVIKWLRENELALYALSLALGPLGPIIVLIATNWDTFRAAVENVAAALWDVIDGPLGTAKTVFDSLRSTIGYTADRVWDLIEAIKSIPNPADFLGDVGGVVGGAKGLLGFAGGVRDFAGGYAVVGERGPEIVKLPRGSDVYTNSESRAMAGGVTQHITVQNMYVTGDPRTAWEAMGVG